MLDRYEEFTKLISNINKSIQRIKLQETKKYGLIGSQLNFIYYLGKHNKLSFKDFCNVLNADKAFVSRNIKILKDKKLITENEKSSYQLTKKGLEICRLSTERTKELCKLIYIDEIEIDSFYKNLNKIYERLTGIGDLKNDKNSNGLNG